VGKLFGGTSTILHQRAQQKKLEDYKQAIMLSGGVQGKFTLSFPRCRTQGTPPQFSISINIIHNSLKEHQNDWCRKKKMTAAFYGYYQIEIHDDRQHANACYSFVRLFVRNFVRENKKKNENPFIRNST